MATLSNSKLNYSPPGPPPDLSFYTQQLAEQLGGSDKGPSGPSFLPENFQYMQAAVGPVGKNIILNLTCFCC
jgi:hypothetical protein